MMRDRVAHLQPSRSLMLTPAEELGLRGLSLSSRVRKAFHRIPETQLLDTIARIRDESLRRHLIYQRDGKDEPIHILPCPLTALPDQVAYIHSVSLAIHNALKRLPEIYMKDLAVREVLRLSPDEEEWLWKCWGRSHLESDPVFGRLDAVVDFTIPMWKDSLRFLEPNMSGIGGLYLVPACERLLGEEILPLIHAQDEAIHLEIGQDIRDMLMEQVLDHLRAIGRPAKTICFLEPKYAVSGVDEQEILARWFGERYGLTILHADPRELELEDGEVRYRGHTIDLAYRDYSVLDLLDRRKEGIDVQPTFRLFEENRIVSSITAELDQKACWEVFTDPEIAQRHYSADERQVFRRHVLWTRVLSDRRTLLSDGSTGDLLRHVRDEQEFLVIKPNRAYGGQGVTIGPAVSAAEWQASVEQALASKDRWVVQQLASIPVSEFPVVGPDGRVHVEPFYVVMGFASTRDGLAILGRASQKQVVNIAQRGGLCAIMVGQAPGRLLGPLTPEGGEA
jgi:hypothetical protein